MIYFTHGNIVDSKETYICHQVNCKNAMGAGVARAIYTKWPTVKTQYHTFCNFHYKRGIDLLGKFQVVPIETHRFVINIFGQRNFGNDANAVYTDYDAFAKAVNNLFALSPGESYAFPYKIGCGLANGDWNKIYEIIRTASEHYNTTVVFYSLTPNLLEDMYNEQYRMHNE